MPKEKIYGIALYNINSFVGFTGYLSSDYNKIKDIYDKDYRPKPFEMSPTDFVYRIVELKIKPMD